MTNLQMDPDRDIARASTLAAPRYFTQETFDEEKNRIFSSTWQLVGHAHQVANPGDYFTFDLIGGLASDRFGRRPVMIVGAVGLGLSLIPGFMLINAYPTLVTLAIISFWLSMWNVLGPAASVTGLAEGLPMRVRSAGFALGYSLSVAILGGSTEAVVAWLTAHSGNVLAPAYYILAFTIAGLAAALAFPETAPRFANRLASRTR